jgi:glycerol uptake facilitator-like aquaporin
MPTTVGKSIAEFFGTALLVCVVVGSGIMGTNLSQDSGVALIINTLSTIFALVLLIFVLAPVIPSYPYHRTESAVASFLRR